MIRNTFFSVLFVLAALIGFAGKASAQTQFYFPGTIWNSTGNLNATENRNVISLTHAEQGIAYKGAEVFALATAETAGQHNAWEHRTELGVGTRYTVALPKGMVRANLAWVQESRYVTIDSVRKGHAQMSVDMWFGWSQAAKPRIPLPGVGQ